MALWHRIERCSAGGDFGLPKAVFRFSARNFFGLEKRKTETISSVLREIARSGLSAFFRFFQVSPGPGAFGLFGLVRLRSILVGRGQNASTCDRAWVDSFSANFFSARRNGRKSSVLREIVRFGWTVLDDLEMVLWV